MRVDLVLCGHDHQEAVHYVEHTPKGTIISTAGTMSNRGRGGRPSSVNSITITDRAIDVTTWVWSSAERSFEEGLRSGSHDERWLGPPRNNEIRMRWWSIAFSAATLVIALYAARIRSARCPRSVRCSTRYTGRGRRCDRPGSR